MSVNKDRQAAGGQKNEGEGNKTAAREFNKAQHEFVQAGKVDKAAEEARKAVDGAEGAELEKAEDKARKHAKH